ncbi:hypothetical protein MUK42_13802 [Musa troglodytarum]|uniref:Uncharacterized protein n=2 Tax=Musa troglodytarum TaxID=320322 RepID=A0A9E7IBI5_9LILI|nr:hypothetical protein MUK42_13802 [Musa troglodytarum]
MRRPAATTPGAAPSLRLQSRMRSRVRRVPGELGGGRCLQVAAGMHACFPCPMRGLLAAAETHLPDLPDVGGSRRGGGPGRGRRHEEFGSQVRSARICHFRFQVHVWSSLTPCCQISHVENEEKLWVIINCLVLEDRRNTK